MAEERQQILILHSGGLSLAGPIVAWALFDGAQPDDDRQMKTGDADEPPYASVVEAMRDGWRVLQLPQPPSDVDPGHLDHEYVLERMVPVP
jgi:hypothetical protein